MKAKTRIKRNVEEAYKMYQRLLVSGRKENARGIVFYQFIMAEYIAKESLKGLEAKIEASRLHGEKTPDKSIKKA